MSQKRRKRTAKIVGDALGQLSKDGQRGSRSNGGRKRADAKQLNKQLLQHDLDLNELIKQMQADGDRST